MATVINLQERRFSKNSSPEDARKRDLAAALHLCRILAGGHCPTKRVELARTLEAHLKSLLSA